MVMGISFVTICLIMCTNVIFGIRLRSFFHSFQSIIVGENVSQCENGVCSINSTIPKTIISNTMHIESNHSANIIEDNINILIKLGWTREDSIRSLDKMGNDVTAAGEMLSLEEEEKEDLKRKVKELSETFNWNEEACKTSLIESKGNITEANMMLENEEKAIESQFSKAVKEMVDNGWEEVIARQALLAQWSIDQRRNRGVNTTIEPEVLASIRPSLKRVNESTSTNPTNSKKSKVTGSKQESKPKPAKKEDVVFDVSDSNFQKIVIESTVPVILDVYADWCGPCKQLGPILEKAAIDSGGMFRLAKLNSDKEKRFAEALEVTALPTVFAVNNGKLSDRFLGMLPAEQLQDFLVRAITGYGDRVQKDIDDVTLQRLSEKVTYLSGLSSISFQRKEKLKTLVTDALEAEDGKAFVEGSSGVITDGLKTSLLLIQNCVKDIQNPKFRTISCNSKVYKDRLFDCPAGLKLLDIAGFKLNATASHTDGSSDLQTQNLTLVHKNPAILTIILQRVDEIITSRKFSKLATTTSRIESKSVKLAKRQAQFALNQQKNQQKTVSEAFIEVKPTVPTDSVVCSFRMSLSSHDEMIALPLLFKQTIHKDVPLKQAIQELLETGLVMNPKLHEKEYSTLYEEFDPFNYIKSDALNIEVKYPLPKRILTKNSKELTKPIGSFMGSDGMFNMIQVEPITIKKSNTNNFGGIFGNKKVKPVENEEGTTPKPRNYLKNVSIKSKDSTKNQKNKQQNLFSSGILSDGIKKNNEYFGGDSTVVQGGDEDNEMKDEKEKTEDDVKSIEKKLKVKGKGKKINDDVASV